MSHSRHTKPWAAGEAERKGFATINSFFKKPALTPPVPAVGRPPKKRRLPVAGAGLCAASPTGTAPVQPPTGGQAATAPQQRANVGPPLGAAPAATQTPEGPTAKGRGGDNEPATKTVKAQRVNYGVGQSLSLLRTSVQTWDRKLAEDPESLGPPCKRMERYSLEVGIPFSTFKKYACADLSKRRKLGTQVGRPQAILDNTGEFVVDVMRRKDRANEGMTRTDAIDMLQDLQPEKTRTTLARSFDRNVRPKNKDKLTGCIKAQASTKKRSAITVEQQYRWHKVCGSARGPVCPHCSLNTLACFGLPPSHTRIPHAQMIDYGLEFLQESNVGLTPDGKTYDEVSEHFMSGGDETGLEAANGNVTIIGDKAKQKHELQTADSRVRTTIYRTGNSAGNTGPAAFLPPGALLRCACPSRPLPPPAPCNRMNRTEPNGYGAAPPPPPPPPPPPLPRTPLLSCIAGANRRFGYHEQFLEKFGAPKGSCFAMTEQGYMTEKAWIEITPKMVSGLRNMPIVRDMPHWWMIHVVDGFGPHTTSLEAMRVYADAKILLIKEEGDSSHVNQAYDRAPSPPPTHPETAARE